MEVYIFYRGTMFYPLTLTDDAEAVDNALLNPGTTKVERVIDGEIIWKAPVN